MSVRINAHIQTQLAEVHPFCLFDGSRQPDRCLRDAFFHQAFLLAEQVVQQLVSGDYRAACTDMRRHTA